MKAVSNAWCNFTYLGPRPDIGALAVQRETRPNGDKVVRSFWRPTAAELDELQRGGTIVLSVLGEPIPPVALCVEFPPA